MDGGVVVEPGDHLVQLALRDICRKVLVNRLDAHLCTVFVLERDVTRARCVVAYEDRAEAGYGARLAQPLHPLFHL